MYTLSFPLSSYLRVPDVHAFVKGAAGQMPTVGTESHAVDRLLVFSQRMDTDASLHVPKANCGVKRCAVEVGDGDKQAYRGAAVDTSACLLLQEKCFTNVPIVNISGQIQVLYYL